MSSKRYTKAQDLLDELGIAKPEDIQLEAIAEYAGATLIYKPLSGAEGRLMGYCDRAVITVNPSKIRGRERFSGAHELGHWARHRHQTTSFTCTRSDMNAAWTGTDKESVANEYASDLLLPETLFQPLLKEKEVTFVTVKELGDQFETSLTATAIRMIRLAWFPSMVICHSREKRKWFARSGDIERANIWPLDRLVAGCTAHRILQSEQEEIATGPEEVDADTWINHDDASDYTVVEHSIKVTANLSLTLLWWRDQAMLNDFST